MVLNKFLVILSLPAFLLIGCSEKTVESDVGQVISESEKTVSEPVIDDLSISQGDAVTVDATAAVVKPTEQYADEIEVEVVYAGEELYPSEPEFSPHVQEVINIMDGNRPAPEPAPELKQEYKDVVDKLERQISGY
jgi:hypothetical protein